MLRTCSAVVNGFKNLEFLLSISTILSLWGEKLEAEFSCNICMPIVSGGFKTLRKRGFG